MIIIAVDYYRAISTSRLRIQRLARVANGDCATVVGKRKSFIGSWRPRCQRVGKNGGHGYSRWFERLLAALGIELWMGDAAEIKTNESQQNDRNDAHLLLKLLLENNFPTIWIPSPEIVICGNCCGIGTAWCRCERES